MQTRHALVTLVGLAVILLFALVVSASAPLAEPVTFQESEPSISISLNTYNGKTEQGQSVAEYTFSNFQGVTCDINVGGPHSTAFNDPCYHRTEVYARGTTDLVSGVRTGQCWRPQFFERYWRIESNPTRSKRNSQYLPAGPVHTESHPDGFGQGRSGYGDSRF